MVAGTAGSSRSGSGCRSPEVGTRSRRWPQPLWPKRLAHSEALAEEGRRDWPRWIAEAACPRPMGAITRVAAPGAAARPRPLRLAGTAAATCRVGSGSEIDPATLAPGTRLVQFGAFDSDDQARAEWQRLAGAVRRSDGRQGDGDSGGRKRRAHLLPPARAWASRTRTTRAASARPWWPKTPACIPVAAQMTAGAWARRSSAARARSCWPEERAFFRDADPFGFILFARNVETPDQLRR